MTTELPSSIRKLYRHWGSHVVSNKVSPAADGIFVDPALFEEMRWFIGERMAIWKKKTEGAEASYTDDPILSTYRFCNIFRELDKQTIRFHTMLNPLRKDLPLWLLNMFFCRMVARPETIEHTGFLSLDDDVENGRVFEKLMALPSPKYGTPYVFPISVIQRSDTPTRELFITRHLPTVMRAIADEIQSWKKMPVFDGVKRVVPTFGYQLNFLWTEVLIDVAYQFPKFVDLFARFPVGPGSAPTLARISPAVDPSQLVVALSRLNVPSGLTLDGVPLRLSAENWEGICCEFRKYTNLKQGRGRRRLYSAGKSPVSIPQKTHF